MKKIITLIVLFIGTTIVFYFLGESKMHQLTQSKIEVQNVDWIILLGNGNKINAPALIDRLNNTVLAHNLWPNALIFISGDESDQEVSLMKKYLLENQVPETNMVLDETSRSTWDTFVAAKQQISEASTALIITNEFHQKRALSTARLMNLKAATFGKDSQIYPKRYKYSAREFLSGIKWYWQATFYRITNS